MDTFIFVSNQHSDKRAKGIVRKFRDEGLVGKETEITVVKAEGIALNQARVRQVLEGAGGEPPIIENLYDLPRS